MTRAPDGTWLLYSIGHGVPYKTAYRTGCSGGVTRKNDPSWREGPLQPDNYTIVLSAPGPGGPWRPVRVPTYDASGAPAPHLDNPAPLPPHSLLRLAEEGRADGGEEAAREAAGMVLFSSRPPSLSAKLLRPDGHASYGGCPHAECSQLGVAYGPSWHGVGGGSCGPTLPCVRIGRRMDARRIAVVFGASGGPLCGM